MDNITAIETLIHKFIEKSNKLQNERDNAVKDALNTVVDPIPSALVLTAIVIGVAITALMLSYAVQLYKSKGSLSIEDYEELKW